MTRWVTALGVVILLMAAVFYFIHLADAYLIIMTILGSLAVGAGSLSGR